MFHHFLPRNVYLTFQARWNKSGTRKKPCGMKRLEEELMAEGEKYSRRQETPNPKDTMS